MCNINIYIYFICVFVYILFFLHFILIDFPTRDRQA